MKTVLKLIGCWLAFVLALIGYGLLAEAIHLPEIKVPGSTPVAVQFLAQLVSGAILVLGLFPLARGLAGRAAVRSMAVVAFLFLVLGVNGVIEARIFSHLLDGKVVSAVVYYAAQALLVGIALGLSFRASGPAAGLASQGPLAWSGRGIAAWLAWPVIYLGFGMTVAPIVIPYYDTGVAGLQIPPMSSIVTTQLVRSVVFLVASLPLIALWQGSRRRLWLALGLAHAVVVGLYGLAAATFMPWTLRIVHSAEITADSFVYAGLLVALFAAPARRAEIAAPQAPSVAQRLPL